MWTKIFAGLAAFIGLIIYLAITREPYHPLEELMDRCDSPVVINQRIPNLITTNLFKGGVVISPNEIEVTHSEELGFNKDLKTRYCQGYYKVNYHGLIKEGSFKYDLRGKNDKGDYTLVIKF